MRTESTSEPSASTESIAPSEEGPPLARAAVIAIGVLPALGSAFLLWDRELDVDAIPWLVYLVAALVTLAGLLRSRRWALWVSRGLALLALLFGVAVALFVFTFHIFGVPPLRERIADVLRPGVLLPLILPLQWLAATFHPAVVARFREPRT